LLFGYYFWVGSSRVPGLLTSFFSPLSHVSIPLFPLLPPNPSQPPATRANLRRFRNP
jgi:hypothetical protein